MATTSHMIQFYTEQYSDELLTTVEAQDDEAFFLLDPARKTVIRELATQEEGGILASAAPGMFTFGFSDKAFAELKLVSAKRGAEQYFYAPSHVPSPPFVGPGLVVFRVAKIGLSVTSSARLSVSRRITAHAYIDQID